MSVIIMSTSPFLFFLSIYLFIYQILQLNPFTKYKGPEHIPSTVQHGRGLGCSFKIHSISPGKVGNVIEKEKKTLKVG